MKTEQDHTSRQFAGTSERRRRSGLHKAPTLGTWLFAACAIVFVGCGSRVTDDTGTETHWLQACNSDDECGGRLSCLCNVCTRECSDVAACPSRAPHCVTSDALGCSVSEQLAVCFDESENALIAKLPDADAGSGVAGVQLELPEVDDRRPDPSACDSYGWCWLSPSAPGERFLAFSADRQFAVGERGVVFSFEQGYLDPPTATDLTSVVVLDGQPWVGSSSGVWGRSERGWTQLSDVGVSALAVTRNNEVWALRGNGVARLDIETWIDVTPTSARKEMLFFHDLAANAEGTVSVLGGYFLDKSTTEGTLFTWDGSAWIEHAASSQTGNLQFFEGAPGPYAFSTATFEGEKTRVFDPLNDWSVVAERDGVVGSTVFWGPDGHWWLGGDTVFSFVEPDPKVDAAVTCGHAINWDQHTVLCAGNAGGLHFLRATEGGAIEVSPTTPTYPAFAGTTFSSQPTPVWAQTTVAWAMSQTDIWRSPLDHFEGRTWRSMLSEGDNFVARIIDGSGSEDVWFASETELRHWDGNRVSTVAPPTEAPLRILSLHVVDAAHVWVVVETTEPPYEVLIASYPKGTWVIEHQAAIDFTHAHGSLAGTSPENLWATLGHSIYRHRDGLWTPLIDLDAAETIVHSVSDDVSLWVLSDTSVYRLDETQLTLTGRRSGSLDRLALTPEYVWNFDGASARRLPR